MESSSIGPSRRAMNFEALYKTGVLVLWSNWQEFKPQLWIRGRGEGAFLFNTILPSRLYSGLNH